MRLINQKPLTLPLYKSGKWLDDFAITGATDRMYSNVLGKKIITANGMQLQATTTTTADLFLSFFAKNFEAETVMKRNAGSLCHILGFRYGANFDSANRMFLTLSSAGDLVLRKIVATVDTTIVTVPGVSDINFKRFNIRAIGTSIEVFVDGIKVINQQVSELTNNGLFRILSFDAVSGVGNHEWKYLAIKPL